MNNTTPPLRRFALGLSAPLIAALAACGSAPPVADWQVQSHTAMQRALQAYLQGRDRVATAELALARKELSSTGRADLLANAELVQCAAKSASLVWEECTGFAPLRADATPAQRAYAGFLRGQVTPAEIALLPPAQHAAAKALTPDAATAAVAAMGDPLSQLVAASALLQTGKASPALIALAVETASAQGWRRPLLAWLGVQALRAERAGQPDEAAQVRRRMDLVQQRPVAP